MNHCDELACPCEYAPSLAALYTFRAMMGLLVQDGRWSLADYDGLRLLVRTHEAAWQAGEAA